MNTAGPPLTIPQPAPPQQRLDEHADDHAFGRRLAAEGGIHLAETEANLHRSPDRVVAGSAAFRSGRAMAAPREFCRPVDIADQSAPRAEVR